MHLIHQPRGLRARPAGCGILGISSSVATHHPLPPALSPAQGMLQIFPSLFPRYSLYHLPLNLTHNFLHLILEHSGSQRVLMIKQGRKGHFDRPVQGEKALSQNRVSLP